MRYVGSKGRYASHIIPVIMKEHPPGAVYVEPFCGGGNIISAVPAQLKWGNDLAHFSMALLKAVGEGYVPPMRVTEAQYREVRAQPEKYPPELVGFMMYCMSFGGKAWGGYARSNIKRDENRNYAAECVRQLLRQAPGLRGCHFTSMDYRELVIPEGATVYCDPPYAGTYDFYRKPFDTETFWKWAGQLSKRCRVFVSEYSAPSEYQVVWAKVVSSSPDSRHVHKSELERLYRCHSQ